MRYESENDKRQNISSKETENSYAFLHFHRSLEIHYVISGQYEMTIGTQTIQLNKGDIGFVPSFFPHSIKPLVPSVDEVFIVPYAYYSPFEKEGVKLVYSNLTNKEVNKEIYEYILKTKERLEILNEKHATGYDLKLQGYVNLILSLIVDSYPSISSENIKFKNNLIEEIITYIDKHYSEDIKLEDLAEKFGYTKYYFSKLFNKFFNCNLRQYINNIRVYHIMDNEKNSNMTTAILNVGYKNLSTFYKYKKRISNYEDNFDKN